MITLAISTYVITLAIPSFLDEKNEAERRSDSLKDTELKSSIARILCSQNNIVREVIPSSCYR